MSAQRVLFMRMDGWKCISGPDVQHTYYVFTPKGIAARQAVPRRIYNAFAPIIQVPGNLGETPDPHIGLDPELAERAILRQGYHLSFVNRGVGSLTPSRVSPLYWNVGR